MSSTNRGTVRNADDYYVTPQTMIDTFLSHFLVEFSLPKDSVILDPSAGGCDKHEASYPAVLAQYGFNRVDSWDIREDSRAECKGIDFTNPNTIHPFSYDAVITNPPFKLADEFTYQALEMVREGGFVVMLQRLNWLGSQKRHAMWQELPLVAVFVHSKRPGFNPEKPNLTDSTEYAHFVFCKGAEPDARLFVI
ncbi:SAM-dependent methyltransferase [Pseudoalteromonas tunicata]|jgi:hypothetical protein|uniref:Methyltransferase small domain-containing protein n=1 Tax=Pseudoalteromonas tunicata D2 TaxID=87626 RepID=A4C8R6_9GAMM|nr:SAM-dependent methyltransferase [Pseudoalteromonas tunicata]ATC93484.1 hypothetical protein PTUN_a0736 [Pseudoalteromonas tunicata]AXT32524.1 SAM-dependent methyltransferase [Pseudoalteromonas tunicata]EAR28981.1 hypothetical protein PTD2_08054 [Pseudoalteromonas tunicata D2]